MKILIPESKTSQQFELDADTGQVVSNQFTYLRTEKLFVYKIIDTGATAYSNRQYCTAR